MDVTHFVLQQAWCPVCAQWTKAQVPPEHTAGYGPRLTALMGEIAGHPWHRSPDDPDLLCLGPPGPAEPGRHPEDARSRGARHRATLSGHCDARRARPRSITLMKPLVSHQHAAVAVGDGE